MTFPTIYDGFYMHSKRQLITQVQELYAKAHLKNADVLETVTRDLTGADVFVWDKLTADMLYRLRDKCLVLIEGK